MTKVGSLPATKLEGPDGAFGVTSPSYKDGRYEVLKRLSQGGEGYTLICRDELSEALVVLKGNWWHANELSPHTAQAVNADRTTDFKDEIDVLRQLSQRVQQVPALIDLFSQRSPTRESYAAEQEEYVLDEEDYWDEWFAVHQFIGDKTGSAGTLGDLIGDPQIVLTTEDLVDLVEQLSLTLEGMYRPYSEGDELVSWVHCDIKPDNILVVGTPRRYFLIDFHSVSKIDRRGGRLGAVAESGQHEHPMGLLKVATPDYAPPGLDQISKVDQKFDIYSLGATLYEAATGISPGWIAGSPGDEDSEKMVRRQIKEELQEADVHPALIGAIRHCLWFSEKYRLGRIDNLRSQVAMVRRSLVAAEILRS